MKNNERKKNFRINTQRFNVSISKVVYKKFKEKMKQEGLQSTRVLSQFIANYVLYLDRSFVKNNHRSRLIEQFMENYIDFIDKKKK